MNDSNNNKNHFHTSEYLSRDATTPLHGGSTTLLSRLGNIDTLMGSSETVIRSVGNLLVESATACTGCAKKDVD
jgi:hypothetical protein